MQLGRQDVYFDYERLKAISSELDFEIVETDVRFVQNVWLKNRVIDDITLFKSVGFHEIDSIDFVADESPSIIHDMNQPITESLSQKFDVVFDSGTLEHVFDVASAFRNVHDMLKPGGIVIHDSPTNNYADHGFWQISPTVFVDLYKRNKFSILEMTVNVFETVAQLHDSSPVRYIYDPKFFQDRSIGRFPKGLCSTFFVAQKPPIHEPFQNPIRGFYQQHWKV